VKWANNEKQPGSRKSAKVTNAKPGVKKATWSVWHQVNRGAVLLKADIVVLAQQGDC
jgi:hypothetical protein